jgi:hypothetical protein
MKNSKFTVRRKYERKDSALIYVVYVSDTKDDNILEVVRKAIETTGKEIAEKEGVAELSGMITKKIIQHPSKRR